MYHNDRISFLILTWAIDTLQAGENGTPRVGIAFEKETSVQYDLGDTLETGASPWRSREASLRKPIEMDPHIQMAVSDSEGALADEACS